MQTSRERPMRSSCGRLPHRSRGRAAASSRGATAAAERVAQRTERAYWYLRKLLKFTPRFRLLVLDREDWTRYADLATYGVSHFTAQGNLVVGAEPADAWHDIAR